MPFDPAARVSLDALRLPAVQARLTLSDIARLGCAARMEHIAGPDHELWRHDVLSRRHRRRGAPLCLSDAVPAPGVTWRQLAYGCYLGRRRIVDGIEPEGAHALRCWRLAARLVHGYAASTRAEQQAARARRYRPPGPHLRGARGRRVAEAVIAAAALVGALAFVLLPAGAACVVAALVGAGALVIVMMQRRLSCPGAAPHRAAAWPPRASL